MNGISFSIIIPHYNIPEMLTRCLRSIPERDDIQVIIVDDGSPDSDNYLSKYPELSRKGVEFHMMPHQGRPGLVRNKGLEYAIGERIIFIDADDFFVDNVSELFDTALSIDKDMIAYPALAVMSDDLSMPSTRLDRYQEYYEKEDEAFFRYYHNIIWGKIIKRSLIADNNLKFPDYPFAEDNFFATQLGILAQSVEIRHEMLLIVTDRADSLSFGMRNKTASPFKIKIHFKADCQKALLLKKHHIELGDEIYHILRRRAREIKASDKLYYPWAFLRIFSISPSIAFSILKSEIKKKL